ncbi:MAG: 23S rRNA (uracil(1939)-C(5))-methyltransferase RlmD [Clostridia bacterium]|nr:23S rRNA (uracil(1939)-C(5))-methyltransferase RlmD [Clostridia bacterium]
MLQKNELYDVTIEEVNNLGYGVCRIDGQVVFVAQGVTGDRIRAHIIKVAKSYAVARIAELLSPSVHRTVFECAAFPRCGGCSFLHLTDEYERELKEGFVKNAVRAAGLDLEVRPLLWGKRRTAYRNKAQYPLYADSDGHIRTGFYARKTHAPIDAAGCLLTPPYFTEIARFFCEEFERAKLSVYDEETASGLLRHLNLRCDADEHVTAEIVVNAESDAKLRPIAERAFAKFERLVGVGANFNTKNTNVIRGKKSSVLCGELTLCQRLCDKSFLHGPASFFQVNTEAAELLFREAQRLLEPREGEDICDLYCGVGAVGQCIAAGSRLHGADVVREAIAFAEKNAAQNGIDASYVAMDAAEYFAASGSFDAVLVDPPRGGMSEEMTRLLLHKQPKKILYISCNPQTLCRDLVALTEKIYETDGITPVDLFPKTGHVESVCLLTKK